MIIRPDGLKTVATNYVFNFQNFEFIEIDLAHVNRDMRSSFSKEEAANIFVSIVGGTVLNSSNEKEFADEFCSYFVEIGHYVGQKYKLVFCICSDRPTSIGLITLYRI